MTDKLPKLRYKKKKVLRERPLCGACRHTDVRRGLRDSMKDWKR